MSKHRQPVAAIEPAVTSREGGAQFVGLSPRGFDALERRGVVRAIKIPGMRRKVFAVDELRALVNDWKTQRGADEK